MGKGVVMRYLMMFIVIELWLILLAYICHILYHKALSLTECVLGDVNAYVDTNYVGWLQSCEKSMIMIKKPQAWQASSQSVKHLERQMILSCWSVNKDADSTWEPKHTNVAHGKHIRKLPKSLHLQHSFPENIPDKQKSVAKLSQDFCDEVDAFWALYHTTWVSA